MVKIITTTGNIEGAAITKYLGLVSSNIVIGTNIFSDFKASIKDIIGGQSKSYQKNLDELCQRAINEVAQKATALNANAVVGLKVDVSEISGNKKSMFMVTAIGTAVHFEPKSV
ncbi:MAG: YbjQ family protein [Rikenellaceae bacterium]